MQAISLILLLLAHDGHWFGGREYTVTARWNVPAAVVTADLEWSLRLTDTELAAGRVILKEDEPEADFTVPVPEVRAPTVCQLRWRVVSQENGREIAAGSRDVALYPAQPLTDLQPLAQGKAVLQLGQDPALQAALREAFGRVEVRNLNSAFLPAANIVFVAPDSLDGNAFETRALPAYAEKGATVVILEQTQVKSILGVPLIAREWTESLDILHRHPLLDRLGTGTLHSLLAGNDRPVQLLCVSGGNNHVVLVGAKSDKAESKTEGSTPTEHQAFLCVHKRGSGQLIYCQLPLRAWDTDPRARQLLRNLLIYGLSKRTDDEKDM